MATNKGLAVPKKTSVAPASVDAMERELQQNLEVVRDRLSVKRAASANAESRLRRWENTLSEAKRELRDRKKTLTKNAQEAVALLMADAEQRIEFIKAYEILGPDNKLVEAEEAMTSLLSRLEIQRFREQFANGHQSASTTDSPKQPSLTDDSLAAIDRDLRAWSHSIEALKELRS